MPGLFANPTPTVAVGRWTPRRAASLRLAVLLAAAIAAFVIAWAVTIPDLPLCAFKIFTGRPCPGCGMTRSIVRLCHGDLLASLRFHPLGVVMALGLFAGIVGAALGASGRRDPAWAWFDRRGAPAAMGFAAALVLLWVLRAYVVPEWSPDPIGTAHLPWFTK